MIIKEMFLDLKQAIQGRPFGLWEVVIIIKMLMMTAIFLIKDPENKYRVCSVQKLPCHHYLFYSTFYKDPLEFTFL